MEGFTKKWDIKLPRKNLKKYNENHTNVGIRIK